MLPAGIWSLEYRGVSEHGAAAFTNLNPTCVLTVADTTLDSYAGRFGANGDFAVLLGTAEIASTSLVTVSCSAAVAFTMESQRMIAIQVGSTSIWSP